MDPEDRIINQMERKLGLKKRKNRKLPASFYSEGLGDILDFIDNRDGARSDVDEEYLKYKRRKPDDVNREEDDSGSEDVRLEGGSEQESEDERNLSGEEEEDEDAAEKDDDDDESDDAQESGDTSGDESESGDALREDIYGNLRDKKGNIVPRQFSAKEHLEKLDKEGDSLDPQVMRRIRGLLNRITSSNLPYVSSQIQDLFHKYSRFQICECLTKCASDVLVRDICLSPQKLVNDFALLVAALHALVGEEVGGHVLHALVKRFDELLNKSPVDLESKELDNVVAFLSHLYASNVIGCSLLFDMFKNMCSIFNEKCVELIILLLKLVGFVLRKDSPAQMKNLVVMIRETASKSELASNKRISFMLDTLVAIRNNNLLKLTSDSSPITAIDAHEMKTALKNCLKDSSVDPLHGSYAEVLSGNRWWVKIGQLKEKTVEKEKPTGEVQLPVEYDANVNDEICRKLKLNTPLRKQMFQAIITSDDYIEASQRLLQMCKKNFAEVANVCLYIALHEKVFTLFYTCVFDHLSNVDRKFKLATRFALKDKIEAIHTLSKLQKQNLAQLLCQLMKRNVVPITVLRGIEFCDIDENYRDFLSQVFSSLLKEDDDVIKTVFSKLSTKEKKDADFAAAIKYFITIFNDSQFHKKMESLSLPWKFKSKTNKMEDMF